MKRYNVCYIRQTSEEVAYQVYASNADEACDFAAEMLDADPDPRWVATDYIGDMQTAVDVLEDFSNIN